MSQKQEMENKLNSEMLKTRYFGQSDENKYKYTPDKAVELLDKDAFEQSQVKLKKHQTKKYIRITASCVAACFVLIFGFGYFKPSMLYNIKMTESARNYRQVARALKSINYQDDNTLLGGTLDARFIATGEAGAVSSSSITAAINNETATMDAGSDFSSTNEQVQGVSEGDIVKTDGEYIYILSNSGNIVSVKPDHSGNMETISTTTIPKSSNDDSDDFDVGMEWSRNRNSNFVHDMYLSNNTLSVLFSHGDTVKTIVYSLSNGSLAPIHNYEQDGRYVSSRVTDNCLYTITTKYTTTIPDVDSPEGYVPAVSADGVTGCISPRDITILPSPKEPTFIVATGVALDDGKQFSSKAILGSGYEVFCSTNNLYVLGNERDNVNIVKFSLSKGNINFMATTKVDGYMLNQFSADEYNGNFRIATTKSGNNMTGQARSNTQQSTRSSLVTILDENLKTISILDNIAPNERIYSARFMGDTAYVVTFRETDPLFVINLSDPSNPKIEGELKIPGFSNYLHPLADGKLLGVGHNTDEDGNVNGFKMSLFDVSNPTNPTEADTAIIGGHSYSMLDYTHKSLFYDSNKNLIGFPLIAVDNNGTQTYNGYVLYKISGNTISLEQKFDIDQDTDEFGISSFDSPSYAHNEFACYRGFYINDIFYILGNNNLSSFGYNNYKYLNNIVIK